MEDLFYYHNDETLLKKLSDTFYYFSNVTTHADYAQQVVEKVFLKYKTDLVVNLNNQVNLSVTILFFCNLDRILDLFY